MKLRCKLGDLAMITRDVPSCTANIGKLAKITEGLETNRIGQRTWGIEPLNPSTYLVNDWDGNVIGVAQPGELLDHPDEWMVPIRPGTDDEDVYTDNELVLEVTK